jgi:hypothetical protein
MKIVRDGFSLEASPWRVVLRTARAGWLAPEFAACAGMGPYRNLWAFIQVRHRTWWLRRF